MGTLLMRFEHSCLEESLLSKKSINKGRLLQMGPIGYKEKASEEVLGKTGSRSGALTNRWCVLQCNLKLTEKLF